MTRLEDITANASVRGIVPDAPVTIVNHELAELLVRPEAPA